MIETNIRIVFPGKDLFIWTRIAILKGISITPDLSEKACNALRYRFGIPAIRMPNTVDQLIVATKEPISSFVLSEKDWELEIVDSGQMEKQIFFRDSFGAQTIPLLLERSFLIALNRQKDLWTLDTPRIFYEAIPFVEKDGVSAYRRYEVGVVPIENIGVGIAVDIGTAFFATYPVSYYFDQSVDLSEQRRRESLFSNLTGRQNGQKGTLLYDTGSRKVKCYFEKFAKDENCSSTGSFRIDDQRYESLLDYYKQKHPNLAVEESTPVAYVSFRGLDRPKPVAADKIFIRVMNDDVPDALMSVDKILPHDRKKYLNLFWEKLGDNPLGRVAPKLLPGFWCPPDSHVVKLNIPDIVFGGEEVLKKPTFANKAKLRANFHQREKLLDSYGCYFVQPTMPRTLYCAYPSKMMNESVAKQFALDASRLISKWTDIEVVFQLVPYEEMLKASEKLRSENSGEVAVFILDDDPISYYNASFLLPGWRIKRITHRVLEQKHKNLSKGRWDKKLNSFNLELGKKQWDSFVYMNSLSLLYLMDTIPYRVDNLGAYDAQLAIDVGHDRRFFGLSLMIARQSDLYPSFFSLPNVYDKTDTQHEAINPIMLADSIVEMFSNTFKRKFDALESILIIRDGQITVKEQGALDDAVKRLKEQNFISSNARVDLVDLHKDTLKSIRMWENKDGVVENPLEGTLIILDQHNVVLTTTGSATLHQGTADPILIKSNGHCINIQDAANSLFFGAQLNWFSPNVAQKLPLVLKLTDDELSARAAQEIRRLR